VCLDIIKQNYMLLKLSKVNTDIIIIQQLAEFVEFKIPYFWQFMHRIL